jgi:hypothetical protein
MPLKVILQAISYKTILGSSTALLGCLLLQLKISSRARQWTKSLAHGMLFGSAFFGLIILLLVALIKYRV